MPQRSVFTFYTNHVLTCCCGMASSGSSLAESTVSSLTCLAGPGEPARSPGPEDSNRFRVPPLNIACTHKVKDERSHTV